MSLDMSPASYSEPDSDDHDKNLDISPRNNG